MLVQPAGKANVPEVGLGEPFARGKHEETRAEQIVNPSSGLLPAHHPSRTTPSIATETIPPIVSSSRIPEKPATKPHQQREPFGNLRFWGSFHPVNATGVPSGPGIVLLSVLT